MWGGKKFYFGDKISVEVRNLDRAAAWYQEKLGLRLTPRKSEDLGAFLAFAKDDEIGLALWLFHRERRRRTLHCIRFFSQTKLRQLMASSHPEEYM
jgi:catechol 2,3-dioxygenase-like lactoylglutathione lyase family enzyme